MLDSGSVLELVKRSQTQKMVGAPLSAEEDGQGFLFFFFSILSYIQATLSGWLAALLKKKLVT
jgi:hypothetical protein